MPTKILTTHSQRLSNQLWNIHSKWLSNQSQNIQTNSKTFKLVLEQIQTGYLQKLVLQYNIFKLVLKDQNTFKMVSNQQYPQFYWRWGGILRKIFKQDLVALSLNDLPLGELVHELVPLVPEPAGALAPVSCYQALRS